MRAAILVIVALSLVGCGLVGNSANSPGKVCAGGNCAYPPGEAEGNPLVPVPRAVCGPGSQPETGEFQGQVPAIDRHSGRSLLGYSCNLEMIGKAQQGEGASWQFAWYDDCGYYGTLYNTTRETEQGAVVVDGSDPRNPFVSAILATPAVMDPHESLKVNQKRALLAAVQLSGGTYTAPEGETTPDDYFDIYDVKEDCAHPKLLASVEFPDTAGHEGEWAPDGLTYYGSDFSQIAAIDVSNPSEPTLVGQLVDEDGAMPTSHGLNVSEDGGRLYTSTTNIYDITDYRDRKPNPVARLLGSRSDIHCGQHTIPITSRGKPYLVCVTEFVYGANIMDISDETNPVVASYLDLEVHMPYNQGLALVDAQRAPFFVYAGHYCAVDKPVDPTVIGCGYFESGVRIFDIRDVLHPKEIAYFNPPALPEKRLPGSSRWTGLGANGVLWDGTVDHCTSQVRFIPERGEVWTQCQDNEFLILRFTNDVWPFKE